jgi:uncharacterized lipoprotein YajG
MRLNRYLILLCAALLLVACGTKKKIAERQEPTVSVPAWHTCLVQGARATVATANDRLSANVTMQTVHD